MHKIGLAEQIRSKLASLQLREQTTDFSREAAVLIPVFEQDGEPHFLLTLRTEDVETHKGQISFPGGMRQDGEPLQQTALRETFEEVGIEENRIVILGQFHQYLSVTEYLVTPFAGYVRQPFKPVPQAREVAEILRVPFRIFMDPGRLQITQMVRRGKTIDVCSYSYGPHEIWGLTAGIIRDFLGELEFQ